ncbi:DUF7340 domain-containing protein [Micrococcus lylae]|uniref:DUF7340 domain-containing protein n=1 Tax=Micrococcus lylae TaxID=1273 RepID=UPI0015E105EA|nr:hypothetical protein [Micrococcus lylae]WIK82148.1 hypothetical protein CJ228_011270 [Micrococcus lylae]
MTDLRRLADRLTVVTPVMVKTSAGPVLVQARPLLEELQEEVRPSGERSAGSSRSVGSGAPVALAVLDMLCRIEEDTARLYWLARSYRGAPPRRPGIGGYTLIERVRFVADHAEAAGIEDEATRAYSEWVAGIERLFDPPKVVPLRGIACPACGEATTPTFDDAGELVDVPALSVTLAETPRGRCGECGAVWSGPEVADLAEQVGATPTALHLFGA